jgi:putative membrane protein
MTVRLRLFLVGLIVVLLAAGAARALAHDGQPLEPGALWGAWNWDGPLLASLALAGGLYAAGVRQLWRQAGQGRGVARWQAAVFGLGLLAVFVALISPLDALSGTLLSAHMVQHMLLMLVAAPALVVGATPAALAWAVPGPWRRQFGHWWARRRWLHKAWQAIARPSSAWLLHAGAIYLWHLPHLYQAALANVWLHRLEHAFFFGSALLFWRAVTRCGRRGHLNHGAGVLYVFAMALATGMLGALMSFTRVVWYPAYAATAPAWGLTALEDQQLAGVIMWVPGNPVYLAAGLVLLWTWFRAIERQTERREGRLLSRNGSSLEMRSEHDMPPASPVWPVPDSGPPPRPAPDRKDGRRNGNGRHRTLRY